MTANKEQQLEAITEATVSVSSLCVAFAGKHVLNNINLDFRPGECVGLVGPNGAGKTTLMRALLGLVSTTTGVVNILGKRLHDLTIKERSRHFSYLAQGAPAHWPMTVQSIVELGRMPHRHPWRSLSAGDQMRVAQAMEKTGVSSFAKRLVTSLSGGERSRVMLARAIAADAPFLLADEPAASLDPHYQLEMISLLQQQVDKDHGVIVVLHDLNLAQQFCDRLIVLSEGKVAADGPAHSVLTDKLLRDVFRVDVVRWSDNGRTYIAPKEQGGL